MATKSIKVLIERAINNLLPEIINFLDTKTDEVMIGKENGKRYLEQLNLSGIWTNTM